MQGRLVENPNAGGTLYHELGHAYFELLLTPMQRIHLAATARRDAANLEFGHHARMYHFLKSRSSQMKEVFAEVFAGYLGSHSAGYEDFAERFPHTSKLVADIMTDPEADNGIVYHRPR